MVTFSFDIHLLGLADPGHAGRTRFIKAMATLTGRAESDFAAMLSEREPRLFVSLDRETVMSVIETLEKVGARVEIRPSTEIPISKEEQLANPMECPSCGFTQPGGADDCQKCGLVFAKWERENILKMQREQRLEEALARAVQVREEWRKRAQVYLEDHPLRDGALMPFEDVLLQDETPFLRLDSDSGPLLLTSRRLLAKLENHNLSVPFELISDVNIGGGLVQKKGVTRLQLVLHCPLPSEKPEPEKALVCGLDKDSVFYKDVVMDWAFARNFICGACGAPDIDFRLEKVTPHARCMHCATDHEIDLVEAVAIPLAQE